MKIKNNILNRDLTLVLIAVLGIIVYHQVLSFNYINWDDNFYVFHNPYIKSLSFSNIAFLFSHYYYHGVYEPLQLLTYMFIYQINGLHPLWFHVFTAVLFIFDAMLVYVLLKKLTTPFTATIASLLFLLAPINADSAAWVSELKNTQSLFFILISLISYIALIQHRKISSYVLSLIFFILALLTKQTIATMVIVFFLLEWYMFKKNASNTFLTQIPFYLLAMAAVPILVIGQLNLHASNPAQLGNVYQHFLAVLVNMAGLFTYQAKILFPFNLNAFYTTDIISSVLTAKSILSITTLLVFIILLIFFYKKQHKGFFFLSWYFINMLPAYGIVVVPFYTNWYLFVPSIGVYALIGMGIEYLYGNKNLKKMSIAVACIIITVFGVLDYQRVGVWKDDAHLWKDAVEKSPNYYFGYMMYAMALLQQGKIKEAKKYADKSLELNPYNTRLLSAYAFFALQGREYSKALLYIQKILKYDPYNVDYIHLLATYYKDINDNTNYVKVLTTCVTLDPYKIAYLNELAEYYVNNGETDKVFSLVHDIIAKHPRNAFFYRVLGAYYLKYTNNTYAAKQAFESSLALDPRQQNVKTLKRIIRQVP